MTKKMIDEMTKDELDGARRALEIKRERAVEAAPSHMMAPPLGFPEKDLTPAEDRERIDRGLKKRTSAVRQYIMNETLEDHAAPDPVRGDVFQERNHHEFYMKKKLEEDAKLKAILESAKKKLDETKKEQK